MPLPVLDAPDASRLERELDLRRRGYVPVTLPDALFPQYRRQLPRCRVRQVVPGEPHSRLVWSHHGRSGLDPRAVAPLALVRIADGVGPDPLDPPLEPIGAARWLLDGDVVQWLLRPRHRLLLGRSGATCLLERDGVAQRCLSHEVDDPLLQDVATALGDVSLEHCHRRGGNRGASRRWLGATTDGGSDLLWSALGVTRRLAGWYRRGVTGTPAWELARHGLLAGRLQDWEEHGFGVAETAQWCGNGDAQTCARLRDAGRSPFTPVTALPLPAVDKDRGLNGYDRWQYARRGWAYGPCALCGATAASGERCRTCKKQGRTTPLRRGDWNAYQQVEELGGVFTLTALRADPVRCGDRKCQTPLGVSALDEGVRQ